MEKKPQNLLPIIMEVANGERSQLDIFGNNYNFWLIVWNTLRWISMPSLFGEKQNE